MAAYAVPEESCTERATSLRFDAGVPPAISPTTAKGRHQKMMKQRQLALTRQRNLVKSSICTIQQNDLPLIAKRLPDYGPMLPDFDEPGSCAAIAPADTSALSATGRSLGNAEGPDQRIDALDDRTQISTPSVSLDLDAASNSGPGITASRVDQADHAQVSHSKSRGSCWDDPHLGEYMEPQSVKARPAQGRKFWRPWKSSKRSVSIAESQVESPSLIAAFMEASIEDDCLDSSFSSYGPGLRCFASAGNRAATPWPATMSTTEDDGLGIPYGLPGAMPDRPPSRVQLPIKPRWRQPETQDSLDDDMQSQLRFAAAADGDSAPRSLGELEGEGEQHQRKQSEQPHAFQAMARTSSRLRFKLWRNVTPAEPSLTESTADENKVSPFDVD